MHGRTHGQPENRISLAAIANATRQRYCFLFTVHLKLNFQVAIMRKRLCLVTYYLLWRMRLSYCFLSHTKYEMSNQIRTCKSVVCQYFV